MCLAWYSKKAFAQAPLFAEFTKKNEKQFYRKEIGWRLDPWAHRVCQDLRSFRLKLWTRNSLLRPNHSLWTECLRSKISKFWIKIRRLRLHKTQNCSQLMFVNNRKAIKILYTQFYWIKYTSDVTFSMLPWCGGKLGAYRVCSWGSIPADFGKTLS